MADIGDVVGHDQVVLRIDGGLHIVADNGGSLAASSHGSRVRIGQRDLLVRRGVHLSSHGFERLHLRLERGDLVLQADRVGFLQFPILSPRRFQRCHVALDAGLDLLHPPLD